MLLSNKYSYLKIYVTETFAFTVDFISNKSDT